MGLTSVPRIVLKGTRGFILKKIRSFMNFFTSHGDG